MAAAGGPTAALLAARDGVVLALQRLRWNLQERGPRDLVRAAATSTWRELAHGDEFVFWAAAETVSTDTAPRRRAPRAGHEAVRYTRRDQIPPEHLTALRACIARPTMPESAVEHYLDHLLLPLEQGAEMWLGLTGGVPGGWLFTVRGPEHGNRWFPMFPLSEEDVVVCAARVHPASRGRGLSTLLLRTACTQLTREGARQFFSRVKTWNDVSANALRREGFRAIGIVRPLELLGRTIAIWKS
jgi:GNAT superfamily N-acetyltransferase